MPDPLKARDAKDVEEAVIWALANDKTLEIVGQGSKRGLGRPSQSDLALDLSALTGITLCEPEELVLSARAGTPIAEIERQAAAHNQDLAFEPMNYAAVLGVPAGLGTIGGVLAANLSGPRRIKAGAARDHFLGVTAVSGRGETFKSGGRVVKNVTGYDLCKLLAGSYGTLAVMTDVTVKTLPRAETEVTVLVTALAAGKAIETMSLALGSPCDISGAAHLPANMAARCDGLTQMPAATVFRIEGVAPSVAHRKDALAALLKPFGAAVVLEEAPSRHLWRAIRDAVPFAMEKAGASVLWRVSTAPANGAAFVAALPPQAQYFLDWGGGLIWVALPACEDGGAAALRGALKPLGGHATLVRAPAALRAAIAVFEPAAPALAALNRRVKDSFDPKRVLNPGRMWADV